MYIKIIGSVIILVCTTLIGVDMAGVKKETTERYKKIGEYFALVQERLKCGSSCIADVLTDCSEHFDGIIKNIVDEFVIQLNCADNKTMKEAFDISIRDNEVYKNTIEAEYIGDFAGQWDLSGLAGSAEYAGILQDKANKIYDEMKEKLADETKLAVCCGGFAGVLAVLILI